jgi:hypothetical protein
MAGYRCRSRSKTVLQVSGNKKRELFIFLPLTIKLQTGTFALLVIGPSKAHW